MEDVIKEAQQEADTGSEPNERDNDESNNGEIIWGDEAEKISSGSWFNPDPGTHEVTFLDEGYSDTRTYDGDDGKEEREVAVFNVEVDGDEVKWSVTKGKTETSLWGQLVKVANARGGLEGETITLIRNGTGAETTYTVQEAADL